MRETLYQVMVETRDGKCVAASPAMLRPFCEPLAKAIQIAIRAGNEKNWSNPHIVPFAQSVTKRRPGPRADELALLTN